MGSITVEFADSILIATATGRLSYSEIISAFEKHGPLAVRHIIVNMEDSTTVDLSGDQIKELPQTVQKYLINRKAGSKTAFVCAHDHNFGISRMYTISAELVASQYQYNTFRRLDEALEWLKL